MTNVQDEKYKHLVETWAFIGYQIWHKTFYLFNNVSVHRWKIYQKPWQIFIHTNKFWRKIFSTVKTWHWCLLQVYCNISINISSMSKPQNTTIYHLSGLPSFNLSSCPCSFQNVQSLRLQLSPISYQQHWKVSQGDKDKLDAHCAHWWVQVSPYSHTPVGVLWL